MNRMLPALMLLALSSACAPAADNTVTAATAESFSAIGEMETVRFTGTEPFWGGESSGDTLTYTTPENIDGAQLAIKRFAGLGGLGFSGKLEGAAFDLLVTDAECSDGMSDRTYPFTATLKIGDETRNGCAWTDKRPFEGPENP